MNILIHKHMLIKAFVSNPPRSEDILNNWLLGLVSSINMKVCIPPKSKYVDIAGNRGITGTVVIETSHCSCHFWDEISPSLLQMDVYSCANFETDIILEKLKQFGLLSYEYLLVDRNNNFSIIKKDKITLM